MNEDQDYTLSMESAEDVDEILKNALWAHEDPLDPTCIVFENYQSTHSN